MLDKDVSWHTPESLPHGGEFRGREGVGRFFVGLGEQWEDLELDLDTLVSREDHVIALARIHGRLRATGEETGYSSAHVWTVRDGSPVRFAEYVDAPAALPAAGAVMS